MKRLIMVSIFLFGQNLWANANSIDAMMLKNMFSGSSRCPQTTSSNHLVITLEGLGGELLGSPAYQLAKRSNQSNYQIARYTHYIDQQKIADCANQWMQNAGQGAKVSIIGHSLGGGHAQRVADALAGYGIDVADMIVFDGREGYEGRCGGPNSNPQYQVPANVARVTNFYQCSGLPGRFYNEDSGKAQNIKVNGASHVGLPWTKTANERALALLNADNGGEFQMAGQVPLTQGMDFSAPTKSKRMPASIH